jgi:hypothetical protein
MTYAEKLKHPLWQKKRLEIFERDNFACRFCGSKDKTLIVHHSCYLPHSEPWDYNNLFLYTLCESCHETLYPEAFIVYSSLLLEKERLEAEMEFHGEIFDKKLSLKLDAVITLLDNFNLLNHYRG